MREIKCVTCTVTSPVSGVQLWRTTHCFKTQQKTSCIGEVMPQCPCTELDGLYSQPKPLTFASHFVLTSLIFLISKPTVRRGIQGAGMHLV